MQGMKWLLSKLMIPLAALGRDRRPVVRMGDALNVVKQVLLVLPLDENERQLMLPQLFQFKSDFPHWNLDLLFIEGSVPTEEEEFKGIGIVRISVDDISSFGLPRKDLINGLKERSYDLVIDLSLDSHPFVPYLLWRSQVPLRMGVNESGRMRSRSYNLTVRLKGQDEVLRGLAGTLAPICKAGTV
jgi:hypothetical protein